MLFTSKLPSEIATQVIKQIIAFMLFQIVAVDGFRELLNGNFQTKTFVSHWSYDPVAIITFDLILWFHRTLNLTKRFIAVSLTDKDLIGLFGLINVKPE